MLQSNNERNFIVELANEAVCFLGVTQEQEIKKVLKKVGRDMDELKVSQMNVYVAQ